MIFTQRISDGMSEEEPKAGPERLPRWKDSLASTLEHGLLIPVPSLKALWLKDPLMEFRAVNWDDPDRRLDWMHSASSILQAGPCVSSNQLDFDEEVMFKSTRYLYSAARRPASARPFCLTVSLTHPHDPYTIHRKYWDLYKDVEIPHPEVDIPKEEQDPHSQRLLRVCGLSDTPTPEEAVKRARRAYFGAMSYVDDNVGKLLEVLKECGMEDDTIVIFSSDHGDMLGERGLWYVLKMISSITCGSSVVPPNDHHRKLANPKLFVGTRCLGSKLLRVFLS